jgi:hypothetical protein
MTSNEELQAEIDELRIAVQGMFGMLKHLTVEIGDFSHTLAEVGTQFMTRMGYIWESLGGKVSDETTPDSSEDSDENPDAEIILLHPTDDGDEPVA